MARWRVGAENESKCERELLEVSRFYSALPVARTHTPHAHAHHETRCDATRRGGTEPNGTEQNRPEDLLLTSDADDADVEIADFGFAADLTAYEGKRARTSLGTLGWVFEVGRGAWGVGRGYGVYRAWG